MATLSFCLENGSEFIVYYINSDMSAEDVLPEELSMDKKSIAHIVNMLEVAIEKS